MSHICIVVWHHCSFLFIGLLIFWITVLLYGTLISLSEAEEQDGCVFTELKMRIKGGPYHLLSMVPRAYFQVLICLPSLWHHKLAELAAGLFLEKAEKLYEETQGAQLSRTEQSGMRKNNLYSFSLSSQGWLQVQYLETEVCDWKKNLKFILPNIFSTVQVLHYTDCSRNTYTGSPWLMPITECKISTAQQDSC